MIYTGIVTHSKGANVRPAPSTRNLALYSLAQGAMFEFDKIHIISVDEIWAELADGFLALRYPGSVIERADWWETGSIVWPDNLYKHKHDFELAPYYTARVNQPGWCNPRMRQAPEVFNLYGAPHRNSGQMRLNISPWEGVLRELNPGRNKWNYFTANNSGWFNRSGWPQWEMLAMGGNVYHVLEIRGGWGRIETLPLDSPRAVFPWREPWLVQRFTVVTASNRAIDPPPGTIYCPLVQRRGAEIWIPLEMLVKVV